ncbi:hypothetical protein FB451DRAFT_1173008 [Mycena latifolia]|nr:hypothetical protein FB451DRAFT_1173008 [Mycena latifolia]
MTCPARMSPLALPANIQSESNLAPSIQTNQFSSLTSIKIGLARGKMSVRLDQYRDEVKNFGGACLLGAGEMTTTTSVLVIMPSTLPTAAKHSLENVCGGALAGLRMSSIMFLCGGESRDCRGSKTPQLLYIGGPSASRFSPEAHLCGVGGGFDLVEKVCRPFARLADVPPCIGIVLAYQYRAGCDCRRDVKTRWDDAVGWSWSSHGAGAPLA